MIYNLMLHSDNSTPAGAGALAWDRTFNVDWTKILPEGKKFVVFYRITPTAPAGGGITLAVKCNLGNATLNNFSSQLTSNVNQQRTQFIGSFVVNQNRLDFRELMPQVILDRPSDPFIRFQFYNISNFGTATTDIFEAAASVGLGTGTTPIAFNKFFANLTFIEYDAFAEWGKYIY